MQMIANKLLGEEMAVTMIRRSEIPKICMQLFSHLRQEQVIGQLPGVLISKNLILYFTFLAL